MAETGPLMTDPRQTELQLSDESFAKLTSYIERLLSENKRMNLTSIRDAEQAWQRHIVESVEIARLLPPVGNLLDVGSGGGLPGMVMAIMRPEIDVTLLESVGKKARFLAETAEALELTNLEVICARAEDAAGEDSKLRDGFELVTARAVAAMPTLVELTAPFVSPDCLLLAIKGEKAKEELKLAEKAMQALQVELLEVKRLDTATLVWLRKTAATPRRYPRRVGEPKRKPIGL